ncbi:hypothetical protein [Blastococcus sp. PRF04-17]|uniref:hypothetical protein n=1 Tax=Blastococcus sp. PRF04-17 TaxID=2933797 RepID=UPI001FF4F53E|nr:hypothetical protein [Blastococcus sp. PRF04-17]UOY03726.1 hypothetical protein MVA48_10505 [Blastococcus sp. PRF04-17]
MTGPRSAMQARAAQRRRAALRQALLETRAFSVVELARRRGQPEAATRLWLARRLGDQRLFTVPHDGQELVPAFQPTGPGEDLEPRPELQPLLVVLAGADLGGWTIWTWLTQPSGLLSGQRPVDVAVIDPTRAHRAAERFA